MGISGNQNLGVPLKMGGRREGRKERREREEEGERKEGKEREGKKKCQ